ncbi:MAG: OmpA family protein [Kangiellaceae bacterium]|nr:OmpA family protein [Kangiellaceae bacterium]
MKRFYQISGINWLILFGSFTVATSSLAENKPINHSRQAASAPAAKVENDNISPTGEKFEIQGPYITLGASQTDLNSEILNIDQPVSESFVGLGYQFNNHWSFEAQYLQSSVNHQNQALDNFHAFDLNALYRFKSRAQNSWHLRFGIGARQFDTAQYFPETDTVLKFGGGYDFHLNENLFISLFAETQRASDREKSDLQYGISLNYFFGSTQHAQVNKVQTEPLKRSEPVEKDSDRDGVVNSLDLCPETPLHYMVDSTGCTKFIIDRESVVLNVEFPTNSDIVDSKYHEDIASLARFMRQHKSLSISVEGHTDDVGPADYNLTLSTKRAKAVARILNIDFGINAARISHIGFGEERPLEENNSDLARAKNRRVMAVLSIEVPRPQLKR